MLPRLRGLEGVLSVLSVVLLLGAFRPSYAATQGQVNQAITTLTTNQGGNPKKGRHYNETSGDSMIHAVMWDTTFANVNLAGTKYARADLAYRVFDDGSREFFAEFLDTQIPRGMTMQFVWDTDVNGSPDAMFNATLGLNNGFEPMRRTYIYGNPQEYARENSSTPTEPCCNRYDALLKLLSK
jgi:hypothetical protein